jgi:hypothetical protein
VLAPSFDLALGVVKGKEPIGIQTLVAEPSVERFNQGIVGSFSRTAEVERDLMQVGPLVERTRHELRAIVDANGFGRAALSHDSVHHPDHLLAGDALSYFYRQTLPTEVVHHCARMRRPSNSTSETKSIDQLSFIAPAAGRFWRCAAITWRRGRFSRMLSPSSQYSRYTRL